jgi:hypothetical protein
MATKPTTLVEVLSEQARKETPTYRKQIVIGDRELTISVYPGDPCAVLHLTGARGGKGDLIVVPMDDILSLAEYFQLDHDRATEAFNLDMMPTFNH